VTVAVAEQPSKGVREVLADAWSFRWQVELEAAERFKRLGQRLSALAAQETIVGLANRAAGDEVRHAAHCLVLARTHGAECLIPGVEVLEIAPSALMERQKVLYEIVAACCVTETESTAVLTTLLTAGASESLKPVLRELAADEVFHSRLGWAHLARESGRMEVGFLSQWIPAMLEGVAGPELFGGASVEQEAPELLKYGVLPRTKKRELFVQTCRDVVFPGLAQFGVNPSPGQAWLEQKCLK
jgi:hypothetical protein